MKTINVKDIIEKANLNKVEVAIQLFPDNKFPALALNRVINEELPLDANQISKLSLLAGIPIADMFSGENWKASLKGNVHTFTNGEYRAELNTDTWITKLFHNSSRIHEELIHSKAIPLSDYLTKLDLIIKKNL
jgi:hypothetical protein